MIYQTTHRTYKIKGGLCVLCGEPKADIRIEIEVNRFRGDDDVFKVHSSCLKELDDIAKLYNKKEQK